MNTADTARRTSGVRDSAIALLVLAVAMVGAFLGWQPVLLAIMIGSFLGSIVGVGLIAIGVMRREQYIPFGPFLAVGSILALLFHQPLLEWYWALIDIPQ